MGLISQHAWLFFYSFARNFRRKSLGEIFLLEELLISEKQRFLATAINYSYETYLSARMLVFL